MYIKRMFYSQHSAILISCLLGVGLISLIFGCTNGSCKYNYVGLNKTDLNKTFRQHDQCIKYIPKHTQCSQTKKQVVVCFSIDSFLFFSYAAARRGFRKRFVSGSVDDGFIQLITICEARRRLVPARLGRADAGAGRPGDGERPRAHPAAHVRGTRQARKSDRA